MKKVNEFYTVRGYKMLNAEKSLLTSSMEDYLEMIYRLSQMGNQVGVNQLAKSLNVRPSSASKIVQKLRDLEMVDYEKYGPIHLSTRGKELGKFLLERHNIIEEFLKIIGTKDSRLRDTEIMEHGVGPTTLRNIYMLNKFLLKNPHIIKEFEEFKTKYDEDIPIKL